jgi:plasmid stabilization system protein ParE
MAQGSGSVNKPCRLVSPAWDDLVRIAASIGQFSPGAADRFADEFEALLPLLSANPELGIKRDEACRGLRSFPIGKYLVTSTR